MESIQTILRGTRFLKLSSAAFKTDYDIRILHCGVCFSISFNEQSEYRSLCTLLSSSQPRLCYVFAVCSLQFQSAPKQVAAAQIWSTVCL
ncbi:hypothetical protein Mapa_007406 [Marchantia paleacea]|nr:hypothetical protein Mapa_007406 [Marchantia paleacea]